MAGRWMTIVALLGVLVVTGGACSSPAAPTPRAAPTGPSSAGAGAAPPGCGAEVPGLVRRTVAVGGVTLHVALGGPTAPSAAQAPPVVLLHGFPETWRTWRGVASDLAVDRRVVVPDLRGVGCSSFAPGGADAYDKRALAGDLAALVDALALPPAVVVGHDMGAMTAFAWARDRPDQVARLVLSGGGIPGFGLLERGPPHVRAFAAAPPGAIAREVAGREREFLTRFVGSPAVERSGSLDDAVRAYSRPGRLDAALGQYRALERDAADNRADPRPLPMDVLALSGGAPDLSAATVAPLAPRLQVRVVPGAGHYLQEERPAAVAAAIRAFADRR